MQFRGDAVACVFPVEHVGQCAFDIGDLHLQQRFRGVTEMPAGGGVGGKNRQARRFDQHQDLVAVRQQKMACIDAHFTP